MEVVGEPANIARVLHGRVARAPPPEPCRREMRKRYSAELDNASSDMAVETELHRLDEQHCRLAEGLALDRP